MPAVDTQIRSVIDQFVEDISQLVRIAAVEAVGEALGQGGASAPGRRESPSRGSGGRAPVRKPGRSKGSGKRIRRSSGDLEAVGAAILAHVRANPGARMEELSAALGSPSKDLRRPVQELMASGQLRTEGQKRATQYFAGGGREKATTGKKGARKKTRPSKTTRKRKTTSKAA